MGQRDYSGVTGIKAEYVDGIENAAGLKELGWLIPYSYVQTEAVPASNGTTASSLVTISGNHVLKAGKAAIKVTPMFEKSGLNFKLAGEVGSKIPESDIELFIPQISADAVGGIVFFKNFRGFILVKRPGQTTGFIQVGSLDMTLKTQDIPGGLGTGPGGEVGYKLQLKAYDFTPMYFYEGELPVPAP